MVRHCGHLQHDWSAAVLGFIYPSTWSHHMCVAVGCCGIGAQGGAPGALHMFLLVFRASVAADAW
jgi:hypothetical protein